MLTDEQLDTLIKDHGLMNCSFNDMVRAIYQAGYSECLEAIVNGLKDMPYYDELKKVLDGD